MTRVDLLKAFDEMAERIEVAAKELPPGGHVKLFVWIPNGEDGGGVDVSYAVTTGHKQDEP